MRPRRPPRARAPGNLPNTHTRALRSFDSSLFSSPAPDLDALHDPLRKKNASDLVAKILADAHAAVHALANDDDLGGYPNKADFLVHSPDQVRVLLDVDAP